MIKAFVFGKFLPFHKGHEALIRFALTQSDFLSVLVCCSDREKLSDRVRKNWILGTFKDIEKIEVDSFNYSECDLPNTSETSLEVSKVWAEILKKFYPDFSLLITSEPYGELVARFMRITHIAFDPQKVIIPVSASMIGQDIFSNWNYLPDPVKRYLAIRVVIAGTESTGKTTLANRLALHYNCRLVSEAGRELIPDSKEFSFNDLHLVANAHSESIYRATSGDSPLVILDTDIHTTISYSKFAFNRKLNVSESVYEANRADLYLYLNNDVSYFQDGTRLNEDDRNRLDHSHRLILKEHRIDLIEIRGDWETRFARAIFEIDLLCQKRKRLQLR